MRSKHIHDFCEETSVNPAISSIRPFCKLFLTASLQIISNMFIHNINVLLPSFRYIPPFHYILHPSFSILSTLHLPSPPFIFLLHPSFSLSILYLPSPPFIFLLHPSSSFSTLHFHIYTTTKHEIIQIIKKKSQFTMQFGPA